MAKTYKSLRVIVPREKKTGYTYKLFGIHTRRFDALTKWFEKYKGEFPGMPPVVAISKMSAHCKSPNELAYVSYIIGTMKYWEKK